MRRLCAIWALLALPAPAQFTSLATNYDGSRLFFTTWLQQRGTNQPAWGKLFTIDANGLRPMMIENRDTWYQGPYQFTHNSYDLIGVSVPEDVSLLAVVGLPDCIGLSPCASLEQATTRVYDSQGSMRLQAGGRMVLSPNGKWGLTTSVPRWLDKVAHQLIDVAANQTYAVPFTAVQFPVGALDWKRHGVANDGTAVLARDHLYLFHVPDRLRVLDDAADSAAIDALATTVVWSKWSADHLSRGLRVLRLSDSSPLLFDTPGRDEYAPRLSSDGSTMLFLSAPLNAPAQVFTMHSDGSGRKQITDEREGISEAVFSGDGRVSWAVTNSGRILKVQVDAGAASEMLGPAPVFLDSETIFDAVVHGSTLVQGVPGSAVTVGASAGFRADLSVNIDGAAVPLVAAAANTITLQVPWELQSGQNRSLSLQSESSPWAADSSGVVQITSPWAVVAQIPGTTFTLAAHQDWFSMVTPANPAQPGEIVHLFATGLGPVAPAVPTGVPAPTLPLSTLVTGLNCSDADSHFWPVDVLYAGLAPGTVGYYQVDLRLPSVINAVVSIECQPASLRITLPGHPTGG